MKYLINSDFEVLRKGEYVEANENAGEFILDTEVDEPTGAVIEGIAEANHLPITHSAKVAAKRERLFNQLAEMPLSEVNEMTDSAKVKAIVSAGVEAGKSDNDMLVEIVNSGVSFKAATKLFKQAMEEGGYRINAKKRAELAAEILAKNDFAPATYDEVKEMAEHIIKEVPDTTNAQALAAIRKYAKENSIELPKPEKKGGGRSRSNSMRGRAYTWMVNNYNASDADLKKFIMEENEKPENVYRYFLGIFNVAREAIKAACTEGNSNQ